MLDDVDVRYLAISLLKQETQRDKQRRVGASNLSNGCDYHLAMDLAGMDSSTLFADRPYGGRVVGTAIHELLASRFGAVLGVQYPDAQVEQKFVIGTLGTYGEVKSTADLFLPRERHLFDWKSTEDRKWALISDAWDELNDREPKFGRLHPVHKAKPISANAYVKEIEKKKYTVETYARQLALYGRGKELDGFDVDALSIVFVSRDATMWWDNPAAEGFLDDSKLRGINVLTFPHDPEFADAVWNRALGIWNALDAGAQPNDFERHPLCWACSVGGEAKPLSNVITLGGIAA